MSVCIFQQIEPSLENVNKKLRFREVKDSSHLRNA